MTANATFHYARLYSPVPVQSVLNRALTWYDHTVDRVLHPIVRHIAEKVAFVVDNSTGVLTMVAIVYLILRALATPSDTVRNILGLSLLGIGYQMLQAWDIYPWDFLAKVTPKSTSLVPASRREITQTLANAVANDQSALIVGPGGAGKTALVEELSRQLPGKIIYQLDYPRMNSATDDVFFSRFCTMTSGMILNRDRFVLFIDEVHQLSDKFRNALKFCLSSGLPVIAATTDREFADLSTHDDAFCRRFRRFDVDSLPPESSAEVLRAHFPEVPPALAAQVAGRLRQPGFRSLPAVGIKFLQDLQTDGRLGELNASSVDRLIGEYRRDLIQPPRTATLDTVVEALRR